MNPLVTIQVVGCLLLAVSGTEADTKNLFDKAEELGLTIMADEISLGGFKAYLSGDEPLTLLAPINDALEWILEPDAPQLDPREFREVLEYYILPGANRIESFANEFMLYTVSEEYPYARVNLYHQGKPTVQVATIQCTPIDLNKVNQQASNGFVHTLTGTLPRPAGTIWQYLNDHADDFSTLISLLQAAGIDHAVRAPGPFTLFAPTNAAFDKLPAGKLDELRNDPPQLLGLLKLHFVAGTYCSAGIISGDVVTALSQAVTLTKDASRPTGGVKVQDANVIYADGSVTNGVVHHIDQVLLQGNPLEELTLDEMASVRIQQW